MMIGGGLMLLFGLLFMLLVIGLPVLLIAAVVAGVVGVRGRQSGSVGSTPVYSGSAVPSAAMARYCSHCGAGLQADWTHCPQCGAAV